MLFAWNPVSILIGGFHGSTDCLCACLCLLAAYLLDWRRRFFLAGLALAGAVNVKLIALVCIPALLAGCRSWRQLALLLGGLGTGALPFLPWLIECPVAFYDKVMAYQSSDGYWGFSLLLAWSLSNPRLAAVARVFNQPHLAYGGYAILAAATTLSTWAYLRTSLSATTLVGLSLALFLVLTPGFGTQYVVYPIPLLFAIDLRSASIYSATAGAFVGLVYWTFLSPGLPFFSPLGGLAPMPIPLIGLASWAFLGYWVVSTIRRGRPG